MKTLFLTIVLISAVILFIFFELAPSLKTPEICGDEAFIGRITLQLINNLPSDYDFRIFGRHFPSATTYTHGALECYILVPFILLGGVTAEAMRTGPILFGVITILLTYWFASRLFNPSVGILSAALLAINSFFISSIKSGGVLGFSLPFFSVLSLFLFLKYINTRNNPYFYLGMFVLGLGLNVKGFFIWFIAALFLTGFLFFRRIITPKTCLIGFINLIIGASPILYIWVTTNSFHKFVLHSFLVTNIFKVNNLDFFNNLLTRINHLNETLVRESFGHQQFYNFSIFLFWTCIALLLYKITLRKTPFKKSIGFLLVLTALIILASSYTFTRHNPSHMIVVLPYIQIIISVAIWTMFESNKYGRIIALLLAISLIGYHIKNCNSMIQQLKKEEQENKNSNVYVITQWLLDNEFYNIVTFEEFILEGIRFNSNLKIAPFYNVQFNSNRHYAEPESVSVAVNNASPDTVFILRRNPNPYYDRINNIFEAQARRLDKEVVILKNFYQSNGEAKYIVCQLK